MKSFLAISCASNVSISILQHLKCERWKIDDENQLGIKCVFESDRLSVRETCSHAKQYAVQLNSFCMNELYLSRIQKCIPSKPHDNRQQSITQRNVSIILHFTFHQCLCYSSIIICSSNSFKGSVFILLLPQ